MLSPKTHGVSNHRLSLETDVFSALIDEKNGTFGE